MNRDLIKRAFFIAKNEGWFSVLKKTYILYLAKTVSKVAVLLYENNSKQYWDFRMKYDWQTVGGSGQSQIFAASVFANIDYSKMTNIQTFLDYGCATGESAIVFRLFFPKAKILLYDLSRIGVLKAIGKYNRFLAVEEWVKDSKVDLVYCGNVIEHVSDPKKLVNDLVKASNQFIILQCPWKEMRSDGQKISPKFPVHEHVWTVDEDFYKDYIMHEKVKWTWTTGVVPMAWEGGVQVFFVGEIIN